MTSVVSEPVFFNYPESIKSHSFQIKILVYSMKTAERLLIGMPQKIAVKTDKTKTDKVQTD